LNFSSRSRAPSLPGALPTKPRSSAAVPTLPASACPLCPSRFRFGAARWHLPARTRLPIPLWRLLPTGRLPGAAAGNLEARSARTRYRTFFSGPATGTFSGCTFVSTLRGSGAGAVESVINAPAWGLTGGGTVTDNALNFPSHPPAYHLAK
jgi:hypothetical protein